MVHCPGTRTGNKLLLLDLRLSFTVNAASPNVPMSRLKRWYSECYVKWPYIMAFGTCVCKGSISDNITQTKLEQNSKSQNEFDWKRNVRFSVWSGLYCGSFQHLVYNVFYSRLFPVITPMNRIAVTIVDCFGHVPFVAMPNYYIFRSLILGGSAVDGVYDYWNEKWNVLSAYWKLWIPAMFCIMSFVPYEFRILSIGVVSIVWLAILSYLAPMIDSDTSMDHHVDHTHDL